MLFNLIKLTISTIILPYISNLKLMKLDSVKLGLAMGILSAACLLLTSLTPWFSEALGGPVLGNQWIALMKDGYPWYNEATIGGVLIGMVWAFIDGFIFAFLLGWLYNRLPGKR